MISDTPIDEQWMGLLTGISYQSGIDYYSNINMKYTQMMPLKHCMQPNPKMILASIDCDPYAKACLDQQYEKVIQLLLQGVNRLVAAGADWLVLCSNTAHISVPSIQEAHPKLPILHIGDTTSYAVKAAGFTKVGLLGTAPTMRESYLKDQLAKHGIETLVPETEAELDQIFEAIVNELSFAKFEDSTRQFFLDQIDKLVSRGCSGVILGCTEIELLVNENHTGVPLFKTAELHIDAAAKIAAGKMDMKDFLPPVAAQASKLAQKFPLESAS